MTYQEDPKNDARLGIYLPADVLRRVKIRAAQQGRRVNAVVVDAIIRALDIAEEEERDGNQAEGEGSH